VPAVAATAKIRIAVGHRREAHLLYQFVDEITEFIIKRYALNRFFTSIE